MLVWNVGLDEGKGPEPLVETITSATLGERQVWRVTHYSQDPSSETSNDFDLYDLDRDTLAPLRSVWNNGKSRLELTFGSEEVVVRSTPPGTDGVEKIRLTAPVQAEGPGETAWVASLPLGMGYQLRYHIVDRWDGQGASRLKAVTLSVLGRRTEETKLGRRDVFVVQVKPEDRSFQITEDVLAAAPHFPVGMEYVRGKLKVRSEVIALTTRD